MTSGTNAARCALCGVVRGLDRHHITPRRMGGSRNPDILDDSNLLVLCRRCHSAIHEGRWRLEHVSDGLRVLDAHTGEQVMRRYTNPSINIPGLFELLNLSADSLRQL